MDYKSKNSKDNLKELNFRNLKKKPKLKKA